MRLGPRPATRPQRPSGGRSARFPLAAGVVVRQAFGRVNDELLIGAVRVAGVFHFVTLVLACFTPIPPDWDRNLALLPPIHRRFAIAQNVSIGAMIAILGLFSLCFAPALVTGSPLARAICATTALFWGGRLAVLPWLGVRPALTTPWLRIGYVLLMTECAAYAVAYGWLALRSA